jgi:hypothetical protein
VTVWKLGNEDALVVEADTQALAMLVVVHFGMGCRDPARRHDDG